MASAARTTSAQRGRLEKVLETPSDPEAYPGPSQIAPSGYREIARLHRPCIDDFTLGMPISSGEIGMAVQALAPQGEIASCAMPKHVEPSSADGAACSAPVPDGVRRQVPDVVPSDADVAACLRVLDALAARPAAFQSPAHRDLRAATRRARDALAQTDFGGGDGLAYGRRRQLRKEREARQSQQAARDRRHRDTTALRRGRIERLRELTERNGRLALAAAAVPLAPDGREVAALREKREEVSVLFSFFHKGDLVLHT